MREHPPEVFILGAGFSKAVSDRMPLMSELSNMLLERLGDEITDSFTLTQRLLLARTGTEGFERALSFLSSEQPWLSRAENHRNRALFLDLTEVLAEVVLASQNQALKGEPPVWLERLVATWHERRAVVITFNYDTLIEKMYRAAVRDPERFYYRTAYPQAMMPIEGLRGSVLGSDKSYIDTLTLLKLHGSVNWLYSGSASYAGETLFDVRLDTEWKPDELFGPGSVRDRSMDKVPLIVPPTTTKLPYFGNEAVDGLWQLAAGKIRGASSVTIMGYSMPPTDFMVRDLLETALSTRLDASSVVAEIVDRNPEIASVFEKAIKSVRFQMSRHASAGEPIPDFAMEYSQS